MSVHFKSVSPVLPPSSSPPLLTGPIIMVSKSNGEKKATAVPTAVLPEDQNREQGRRGKVKFTTAAAENERRKPRINKLTSRVSGPCDAGAPCLAQKFR